MKCTDWRDAEVGEIRPLYAGERAAWLSALSWDLDPSWVVVEQARQAGTLPGWLARDDRGRVRGWTYFALHDRRLQIGGLAADRPATTRGLIDAILQSPEATIAHGLSCFVRESAPGIASALGRARFTLRGSQYLMRDIAGIFPAPAPAGCISRPMTEHDLVPAIRLLADVYDSSPEALCFAPDRTRHQWMHYFVQLLRGPGCGRLLPDATLLAEDASTREALGLVVTTAIAEGVAHIAQVGVQPHARRTGLGRHLVAEAVARAAAIGCRRVTLMVDEGNAPALAMYTRLGFRPAGRFLFGRRGARRDGWVDRNAGRNVNAVLAGSSRMAAACTARPLVTEGRPSGLPGLSP